jgi:zinc/manganese transport system substrate-binding protein
MVNIRRSRYLELAMAAFLLAGCAAGTGARSSPVGAVHVLAAETFLGDIAQNVAGDRDGVETLIMPGVDPHEFQPSPQDAIKIAQSQVLILNGLGYESWLTKALQDGGGQLLTVVATDGLSPNALASGGQTAADPHLWMDPLNVIHYVENIRDGLSKADSAGSAAYAANATSYIAQLKDLDQWIRSQVTGIPAEKRLLVTNHDALGYFAQAYGFKIIGAVIPSVTNEASPSAKQMADLIQTIKSSGAPAIFLDISENPNLAQQIASESGAKVVTSLYVETLSPAAGPAPTYIEMMKYDVALIVGALK